MKLHIHVIFVFIANMSFVHLHPVNTTRPMDQAGREEFIVDQLSTTGDWPTEREYPRIGGGFVETVGQNSRGANYKAIGLPNEVWFTESGIWFTYLEQGKSHPLFSVDEESPLGVLEGIQGVNILISYLGSNPQPKIEPFDRLGMSVSYFTGNIQSQWRTNLSVFKGIRYLDLYPGVDLEVIADGGRITQQLIVRNSSHLDDVRLQVEGADRLELILHAGLNRDSVLKLTTSVGDLYLSMLEVIDEKGKTLITSNSPKLIDNVIHAPFKRDLAHSGSSFQPVSLLMDQSDLEIIYGTYIGGSNLDWGYGVDMDVSGNAYVTGLCLSLDFPTTPGAFDVDQNGDYDAFVFKLNPEGNNLEYAAFLGGDSWEWGLQVAVDPYGNAYLSGETQSTNFPYTTGSFDTTHNGGNDAYLVKVAPNGDSLLFSTFLGGSNDDRIIGVELDDETNPLVTGFTYSSDFPVSDEVYDNSHNGLSDIFLAKFDMGGSELLYSTFIGGNGREAGVRLTMDTDGNPYITGRTSSIDFPTTDDAFSGAFNGGFNDAFLIKTSANAEVLLYSTFLGGNDFEVGEDVFVDWEGAIYVFGGTESSDFPITAGAFDVEFNGNSDAFLVKFDPNGASIVFSTYLGGSEQDWSGGVFVDRAGWIYLSGITSSSDFPTTNDAMETEHSGSYDAFLLILEPSASNLEYSTFIGGSDSDIVYHFEVDGAGTGYLTGSTASSDFPVSVGAYDTTYNGNDDVFVMKIVPKISIDIGFRPNPDGYKFPNYEGNYPIASADYSIEEAIRMFGEEAVCHFVGEVCFPKWGAIKWIAYVNWTMRKGYCDGFASTSLRFYKHLDNPSEFQLSAEKTYELEKHNVRRHIAYYQALAMTEPVASARSHSLESGPDEVLRQTQTLMISDEENYPVLVVYNSNRSSGHSVTPYAIDSYGGGVYRIRVYDNNTPNDDFKYIEINLNEESWKSNLDDPPGKWSGDSDTESIGIIPISIYALTPVCNWCDKAEDPDTSMVWLVGGGHLLITNSDDERLGFVGDLYIDEIADAFGSTPPTGLGIEAEPIYYIPADDSYTINLDGITLSEQETVAVTQVGPGTVAWIDGVSLGPSSSDELFFSADRTRFTYKPSESKELVMALAINDEGDSYEFVLEDVDVNGYETVELYADSINGQFVLDYSAAGGGIYNLKISKLGSNGLELFVHKVIEIYAGDSHLIDYGNWDGTGTIMLAIDSGSDGTIDESVMLENEVSMIFIPMVAK